MDVASFLIGFIPIVGNAKGVIETCTGKDLLTGEELDMTERALNLAGPIASGAKVLGKVVKVGSKTAKVLKEVKVCAKITDNMYSGKNLQDMHRKYFSDDEESD